MKNRKPKRCVYPKCFECPYVDCRYDRLEVEDYSESNNRDYELYEQYTGKKLHKKTDFEYRRNREVAYKRRKGTYIDKHEYNKNYYIGNADRIKDKRKENYDTKTNTIMCRKYRKRHQEERKQYDKEYYEKNKEKKKQQARERYYKNKMALESGKELGL